MKGLLRLRRAAVGTPGALGERASAAAQAAAWQASPEGCALARLTKTDDDAVLLGTAVRTGQAVHLPRSAWIGRSLWTTGATGSGKSAFTLGLLLQLLPPAGRWPLVVVDGKSELVPWIAEEFLPATLAGADAAVARRVLERLRVVRPFDAGRVPALNVLTPVPGLPAALHAKEVATVITEALGASAQVGLRMETILLYALRLALDVGGLSLLEVRELLANDPYRAALVATCCDEEVTSYFTHRFRRERGESVQALLSRLDLLLLSPSAKRALAAEGSLDVPALLEAGVGLIDVGSPPRGAEYLSQFWLGVLVRALARAIMGRPGQDLPPALVVLDEWQTGLDEQLAIHFERLLTLARFKRVGLWLINQLPAQVGARHPALLATLKNSCALQVAFRQSAEDARTLAHLLPPAEGQRADERLAAFTRLPERTCWFAPRALGLSAVQLRSPTVAFERVGQALSRVPSELRSACRLGVEPGHSVQTADAVVAERLRRVRALAEGAVPKPRRPKTPEVAPVAAPPAPAPAVESKTTTKKEEVPHAGQAAFPSLG